jgi:UDPglucose 6-dehydrogenase
VKESDMIFIAVGTPPMEDGSADIQHVIEVSREIGAVWMDTSNVIKSTVPVGTGKKYRDVQSALG